ncbi:uncharacterized protein ACA1_365010 [Acanthamoeba castellanii str. Neff]|uniref:Isopenicillin N synthase-like Fe(2+) 2OG dioxygenase domain-containing protein n=1 Tax=Acanthamoeba castellanii (strain ATCC 30010 / Neff) TaxID=1257118 RepID=L8GMH0_ACACF|nr:uncharacterized protein ACA1_365010 [Acanthamoeba castellanii str. Neff]ELR13953.1 hypothetical protein ACA1_365010 [Acanthamoeba castellanii str. Neff]
MEELGTATAAPTFSYAALQAELSLQGSSAQADQPSTSTDAGLHLQDFFAHLCTHGFARLRLGADEVRCLVEMYGQAREFFGLPEYFKDSVCPYRPSLEIGYSHVRHLAKEFFAVRLTADGQSIETNGAELIPDEYQTLAVESFKLMDGLAKDCLKYIATGLKVDPAKLTSLAEDFPLADRSAHSVSFLHVFKYSSTEAGHVAMPCPPHTDSGLVTVIPCAQAPGLEILVQSHTFVCRVVGRVVGRQCRVVSCRVVSCRVVSCRVVA